MLIGVTWRYLEFSNHFYHSSLNSTLHDVHLTKLYQFSRRPVAYRLFLQDWYTTYACPICEDYDFDELFSLCENNQQTKFYRKLVNCSGDTPATSVVSCMYVTPHLDMRLTRPPTCRNVCTAHPLRATFPRKATFTLSQPAAFRSCVPCLFLMNQ
jgi:hypothetical protein